MARAEVLGVFNLPRDTSRRSTTAGERAPGQRGCIHPKSTSPKDSPKDVETKMSYDVMKISMTAT